MNRALLAFGIALGIHIFISIVMYGSRFSSAVLYQYLPYFSFIICGFVVGYLLKSKYILGGIVLGCLISILSGILHWLAGQFGIQLDFSNIGGAAMLAVLLSPFCITFCILGSTVGHFMRRLISNTETL